MKHSDKPLIEINKAKDAIQAMRDAATLDEFEENWKIFLSRLERVWNKASNHFSRSPKWNGWKGSFQNLRKKDPLLSYFINARGADEHTVNEIVSRTKNVIGINPAEGNSLYIDELTINEGDISIKSPQKLQIEFIPAKTKLLPIINRGRQYPVPKSHLGKQIDPSNVPELANLGLQFYEDFLNQAEAYFVK